MQKKDYRKRGYTFNNFMLVGKIYKPERPIQNDSGVVKSHLIVRNVLGSKCVVGW